MASVAPYRHCMGTVRPERYRGMYRWVEHLPTGRILIEPYSHERTHMDMVLEQKLGTRRGVRMIGTIEIPDFDYHYKNYAKGVYHLDSDRVGEVMGSQAPLTPGRCRAVRRAVDEYLRANDRRVAA